MAQLSDTQLVVLSAACQRPDRSVYPLTAKLNGGAAAKVLGSLITKGLIKEVRAKREDTVWREDKKSGRLTLRATPTAIKALGIDEQEAGPEPEAQVPAEAAPAVTAKPKAPAPARAAAAEPSAPETTADAAPADAVSATIEATEPAETTSPKPRRTRENSKQAQLIAMLKAPEGATIAEIVAAFGWQAHTVRGALAGALKKKLGLNVVSEKVEPRGRVYRVTP
jgi:hypothetical protein